MSLLDDGHSPLRAVGTVNGSDFFLSPHVLFCILVDREMIYLLTKHSLGPGSDFLRRLPGLNRSDIDVMCLSWLEFGSENLEGSCCQLT